MSGVLNPGLGLELWGGDSVLLGQERAVIHSLNSLANGTANGMCCRGMRAVDHSFDLAPDSPCNCHVTLPCDPKLTNPCHS